MTLPKAPRALITDEDVDVEAMYAKPMTVSSLESLIDQNLEASISSLTTSVIDSEDILEDGLRAHVSDVNYTLDTDMFVNTLEEQACISQFAMAAGATCVVDSACELFEAVERAVSDATAAMSALRAGDTSGISAYSFPRYGGYQLIKLSGLWKLPPS